MNIYRESLRLILTTPLSNGQIGDLVSRSPNTIKRYRVIAEEKHLEWDEIQEMDDRSVMALLTKCCGYTSKKRLPDWTHIHSQKMMADVTMQLLWEDYCLDGPDDAYGYSSFTELYREYLSKLDISMRQTHQAGKVAFVDFSGRKIPYYPPGGQKKLAEVFVGVLGSSKYTFAYACDSQKLHDWIDAHNRMMLFFGGVPETIVPDNLKSAVTTPGSEPTLNRTYREMAVHFTTVIVPARVRRPQDKSPAEIGVQIVTRWIIAALRHRKFFSLQEINEEIAKRLDLLNERPFKKLPGCRKQLFEEIERPQLKPLPDSVFEPTSVWTSEQKVRSDYHVYVDKHYYSVPHQLVGSRIESRITQHAVEVFCLGKRVATHVKSHVVGGHTTLPEHQPLAHRKYAEQTPELFQEWAARIGEFTADFVDFQLNRTPHFLPGIRTCSSLMKLAKEYGPKRVEAACQRASQIGSKTLKSVKSILRRNLDVDNDPRTPVQGQLPLHYNVRGPHYYSQEG